MLAAWNEKDMTAYLVTVSADAQWVLLPPGRAEPGSQRHVVSGEQEMLVGFASRGDERRPPAAGRGGLPSCVPVLVCH